MRVDEMPVPSESVEQQRLFMWARMEEGRFPELKWLHHIANEGKRSRAAGGRLKAEGLKKGVPDICLPIPRGEYHGLYVELKRQKGSTPTAEQCDWMDGLNEQGNCVCWCRGWEAAAKAIADYLKRGKVIYTPAAGRGGEYHA